MYPQTFFSLFPPAPRQSTVFVAMSFESRFTPRWKRVIEPAIRAVKFRGGCLEPVRVDQRKVSDAILTQILDGIANCAIVFGDITTIGHLNRRPARNPNVLYEVGMAHATRQPSEVVLFRSDTDTLMFDLSNVRVNTYDPDTDTDGARALVQAAIEEGLRETELIKGLFVRRLMQTIDFESLMTLLALARSDSGLTYPRFARNDANPFAKLYRGVTLQRLLELGMIENKYLDLTRFTKQQAERLSPNQIMGVQFTPLGRAVYDAIKVQLVDPLRNLWALPPGPPASKS